MLKNKVFILFLVFATFICFSSSCFASFSFEHNNNSYEFPDIPNNAKHFVVLRHSSQYYLMLLDEVYSSNAYVLRSHDSAFYYCSNINSTNKEDTERILFPYYGLSSSSEWILSTSESNWTIGQCEVLYSTEDVYYGGELFFQGTPLAVGVLAQVVEKAKPEMTLQEIITILPLIIVVVVCFLGLRKALQMLLSLLRRCLIT